MARGAPVVGMDLCPTDTRLTTCERPGSVFELNGENDTHVRGIEDRDELEVRERQI